MPLCDQLEIANYSFLRLCQFFLSKTLFSEAVRLFIESPMDFEEDTYTAIFSALKHPIRGKILRMLQVEPAIYTEMMNALVNLTEEGT